MIQKSYKMNRHGTSFNLIILALLICITGILVSLYPEVALLITLLLVLIVLAPVFIKRTELLFYVFMFGFAIGEVGIHIASGLPKLSFSNAWLIYSAVIITLKLTNTKTFLKVLMGTSRRMVALTSINLLILLVLIASIRHNSYRSLITQIGYLLVVILVFSVVKSNNVLIKGMKLGFFSIMLLSIMTILTSMGILSFGYRVNWNSGLAPWENILPRAIGLPQMDGGYHSVYILSLLPLALILFQRSRKNHIFLVSVIGTSIAALLIALFRSGWLGLIVALSVMFLLTWRYSSTQRKFIYGFLSTLLVIASFFWGITNYNQIVNNLNRIIFEVREVGVDKRIAQYTYALRRVPASGSSFLLGYGENTFREDFPEAPEADVFFARRVAVGLHNHFLGYAYAYGVPYLLVYIFIIYKTLRWLFIDIRKNDPTTRWVSIGLMAGLLGSIVVLNLTAALSGYKIIWVIVSLSAIIPELSKTAKVNTQ